MVDHGRPEGAIPVRRLTEKPAYRRVAEDIEAMIESGELSPGDALLPERKLGELFGASRTAVREALASLAGAGMIELTGQGAVIRRRDVQSVSGAFGELMAHEQADVLELLETREIIESQAARLAARRCTLADLHRLSLYAVEIEQAIAERADATDPDTNFHLALIAAAHNRTLEQVSRVLEGAMRRLYRPTRRVMLLDVGLADAFRDEHWGVIDALRRRDAAAAEELIHHHLARAQEFTRQAQSGPEGDEEGE